MTQPIDVAGWLPPLIGPLWLTVNGSALPGPWRARANLSSAFTVSDNQTFGRTEVGLSPLHQEVTAFFRDPSESADLTVIPAYGEARTYWRHKRTTNATAASLFTVSAPAAGWGDLQLTISVRVTVSSQSGGGVMTREIVCRRNGGTMAIVHEEPTTIAANLTIATAIAANIDDNDTISVLGTGLAATNINWFVSAHVQITREP